MIPDPELMSPRYQSLPAHLVPTGESPTVAESVAICDWFKDQAAMRATRVAATAERESGVIGLEHD